MTIEILLFSPSLAVMNQQEKTGFSPLCRRVFAVRKNSGRICPPALKNCSPSKLPINSERICELYLIMKRFAQKQSQAVVYFF